MVKIDDSLLNRDPIAEMEKTFGKHHSQWGSDEKLMAMAHFMNVSDQKEKLLNGRDDTTYSTTFDQYMRIAQDEGFTEVKRWTFPPSSDHSSEEHLVALVKDTMLMIVGSWHGSTNDAKIYFTLKPHNADMGWLDGASCGFEITDNDTRQRIDQAWNVSREHADEAWREAMEAGATILVGDIDSRVGLRNIMEKITRCGTPVRHPASVRNCRPWLISYRDKVSYPSHKINQIINQRFHELPQEVQAFMGGD